MKRNKKRISSGVLAGAMVLTSVCSPILNVLAEDNTNLIDGTQNQDLVLSNVDYTGLSRSQTRLEITDVDSLHAFLSSLANDETKIKISGNAVQVNEPITINTDFAIPVGVKLQLFAGVTFNGNVTVNGTVQDSRAPEYRANGIVKGTGSLIFNDSGTYYKQGVEAIGQGNAHINVSENSTLTVKVANGKDIFEATTGEITLQKEITSDIVSDITKADGATILNPENDKTSAEGETNPPEEKSPTEELYDILRPIVNDDSKIKINGTVVEVSKPTTIDIDFTIPAGVKLQLFSAVTFNGTVTVDGIIQDSRALEYRANGVVNGTGKLVFSNTAQYYQQGNNLIGSNGKFKVATNSTIEVSNDGGECLTASSGTITLSGGVTTAMLKKLVVNEGVTFNNANASNIGEGIIFIAPSPYETKINNNIALAKSQLENTAVSTDGVDIPSNAYYVSQSDKNALQEAIENAEDFIVNGTKTEENLVVASESIENAIATFNSAKKLGKAEAEAEKTAEDLLATLQAIDASAVRDAGEENVDGVLHDVLEVSKPITINQNITIPNAVRLKFTKGPIVNATIFVEGQLQDFRGSGDIIGSGVVSASGTGKVEFSQNGAMYIMGKGKVIGQNGFVEVSENSTLSLYNANNMVIESGTVTVNSAVPSELTTKITVNDNTTFVANATIPSAVSVINNGIYIDSSTKNTEFSLNGIAISAESSDDVSVRVTSDAIEIETKVQNATGVSVTLKDASENSATITFDIVNGAIINKEVYKFGAKTPEALNAEIDEKTAILEGLISEAEALNLDAEREKSTVWFANEFQKFANWDEQNMDQNERMFGTITYNPNGKTAEDLAKELPEFERTEIIKMLDTSIDDINQVISGDIVRASVNMFDWTGITHEGSNFYDESGAPVFLHDYFSKPLTTTTDDELMYNHYLGAIDKPVAIAPNLITSADGSVDTTRENLILDRPIDNAGYMMLWHDPVPTFLQNEDGIKDGISNFTKYDINSDEIRDNWTTVLDTIIPQTQGENYTVAGYCIANEPHWFLEEGHWATIKKADGSEGFSQNAHDELSAWVEAKYQTVYAMNETYGTNYASFDDMSQDAVPLDPAIEGTPMWYDVCKFNMDRATEWLTFLNDEVVKNNPDADTHLKIMPDLFVEGNRTHGINFEELTKMAGMIGDDAKIRKENFKATGVSEDWNEDYSYYFKEVGIGYDFMTSVSPEKAHVNSEVHFLSTTSYRDLYMTPEYVRSTYWLATILGMDAGFTWFWGRETDGSIEKRLMETSLEGLLQSYPASVAQQPRVANELSVTMMDLNAHSEEIVKFQEQERPLRLFYSETSAIVDSHYMEHQFDIYEKVFFDGYQVGYATENILKTQNNASFDVVAIYETPYVTDSEFASIQAYLDQGGVVVIDDVSLKFDEHKNERLEVLDQSNGTIIYANSVDEISEEALSNTREISPISISEENGNDQKGAMWRVVPSGDNYVVSVVNVGKNQATLNLSTNSGEISAITDLFTGNELSETLTIAPEEVMFFEISMTGDTFEPETNPTTRPVPEVDNSSNDSKNDNVNIEDGETPLSTGDFAKLTDAQDHWAKNSIEYVVTNGLMNGISDTEFAPNEKATRAMIWTILARMNDVDTTISELWYQDGLDWATQNGVSDGTNPMDEITREQLVTMLWRNAGEPTSSYDLSAFTDLSDVSDYAKVAFAWAVESGYVTGKTETTLAPKDTATRGEIATILERISNNTFNHNLLS